jgi:hypothetical protein
MLNPTLGHARVVRMAIQAFFLEVMGSIKLWVGYSHTHHPFSGCLLHVPWHGMFRYGVHICSHLFNNPEAEWDSTFCFTDATAEL